MIIMTNEGGKLVPGGKGNAKNSPLKQIINPDIFFMGEKITILLNRGRITNSNF